MDKISAFNHMHTTLKMQVGLPSDEWEQIKKYSICHAVPAKRILQAAGDIKNKHHYIAEGLVRLFYTTLDGKELNKSFYSSGHIAGSLSAMILNEAPRFSIETLEPSVVIELPIERLNNIDPPLPHWEKIINYSCKMMLIRNERREAELLTMNAKQRFLQFVKNFPGYLDRIPQYHIATYLGITPVALSKYKNQWLDSQVDL